MMRSSVMLFDAPKAPKDTRHGERSAQGLGSPGHAQKCSEDMLLMRET
jgi:hypothetical protein